MEGHAVKGAVKEKTNLGRAWIVFCRDGMDILDSSLRYLERVTTCIQDPFLRGSKHATKKMSLWLGIVSC